MDLKRETYNRFMVHLNYQQDVIAHRTTEGNKAPYITPADERYAPRLRHFVPLKGLLEYLALTRDVNEVDENLRSKFRGHLGTLISFNTPFIPLLLVMDKNA